MLAATPLPVGTLKPVQGLVKPSGAMQALGDCDCIDEVCTCRLVCGNECVHVAAQVGDLLEAAEQHSLVPFAIPVFAIGQLGIFFEGCPETHLERRQTDNAQRIF